MSNKDYTKYAKVNEAVEPVVETPVAPVVEPVVEAPVAETVKHVVVPVVEAPAEPEKCDEVKTGHVFGCAKLNVRKAPESKADIICTIPCQTEVEINVDKSTEDFYKIYTASGVEGFCMKTYIIIK